MLFKKTPTQYDLLGDSSLVKDFTKDFLKEGKYEREFESFLNKKGYYKLDKIWDQYVIEHHLSPLDLEWIQTLDLELMYLCRKRLSNYQLLNYRLYETDNEYDKKSINKYFDKINKQLHDEDVVIDLQKQSPSMEVLMHTDPQDWYKTNVLSREMLIEKYLSHYHFYHYYLQFIKPYRTFDRDRDRFIYDDKIKYFTVIMLKNGVWNIIPIDERELLNLEFEFLRQK